MFVMSVMLLVPPFLSGITKVWRDSYTKSKSSQVVVNAPSVVPTQNLSEYNSDSRQST